MNLDLLHVPAGRSVVAFLRYVPRKPRGTAIVAAHGYSSSKQNLDPLCAFLCAHGYEVFSLDFPGHKLGASHGRLESLDDAVAAMTAVVAVSRERCAEPFVLGHSLGALTAILTAARDPALQGVVAIATGYGRPAALEQLRKAVSVDLRASYVDGASLEQLFSDADERLDRALPLIAGRPSLYVAAENDAMVAPSSVEELFSRAPERKRFARVSSNHTNAAQAARTPVLQWLKDVAPL
ncbi:MAG: alpha/beta hydrolase [Candidatus Tyrphobacter sp.]